MSSVPQTKLHLVSRKEEESTVCSAKRIIKQFRQHNAFLCQQTTYHPLAVLNDHLHLKKKKGKFPESSVHSPGLTTSIVENPLKRTE